MQILLCDQIVQVQSGTRNTDSKMKPVAQWEAEEPLVDKLKQYHYSDERDAQQK